ncbi:MAG: GDP-mannose 4,6-dehydratase [candidate division Zixibacteria bacterium]|nr:GDP-mannose 4,6-dehydratase [candidate division Zixibacteria bacterium]
MKILITGIAGFVGSHLAKLLVGKKNEVFGICLGCEDTSNLALVRRNIAIYKCDITDFPKLSELIRKIRPDQIYHLAGISSAGRSFLEPLAAFNTNIFGTISLLEAVRQAKLDTKILVVGSGDMYGVVNKKDIPIRESLPLNPVSPYGASKAACDILAYQYFKSYGLKLVRARSFNHTGPGQALGFAIPDFCSQIARIEKDLIPPKITVGDLSVIRDLTDVRDIVKAYQLLMRYGKVGEAYNLCSGKGYKLKQILDKLLKSASKKIKIVEDKNKRRIADILILVGDNSKIKKESGWKPSITLDETLKDTLNYWRKKIEN